MVSENGYKWTTLKDIQQVIEKSKINITQPSYIMALIATFDDVDHKTGDAAAIRVVEHHEKFGDPVS
jgi:hypothetical protein